MKNKWENTGMAGCGQPLCCIAGGGINAGGVTARTCEAIGWFFS